MVDRTIPANTNVARLSYSIWLTLIMFVVVAIIFGLYVKSEDQVDRANEIRLKSFLLADELRQSSDDLTRMVRTYIMTGDPLYKQHFQEIRDIRDGKKPRPAKYDEIYWDLVLANDQRPRPSSGKARPLLELMRQAGFTREEFAKLAQAMDSSNALAKTEETAMTLFESTSPPTEANRAAALRILYDASFHRAKYDIMLPISEFFQMADKRTFDAVHTRETIATLFRVAFVSFGVLLVFMLLRTYRLLRAILGCTAPDLYMYITRLGRGDFLSTIPVERGMENSVLGWLSETRENLARVDAERRIAEEQRQRLTNLYAALSHCNQAIVRCVNESELFPQICHAAVTYGGMKMAWIGLLDEHGIVRQVASYGKGTEYLDELRVSMADDDPTSYGPIGTAIRENKPYWCQDFQHDPSTALWHERSVQFNWKAAAALPLHRNNHVIGIFTLYSDATNHFDESMRNLLQEMATDVDYALNSFYHEAKRKQAEQELLKLSQAVEQSSSGIIITDLDANIEYANEAFTKMTGYSLIEVVGKNPHLLQSGRTLPSKYEDMWAHLTRGENWQGEFVDKRKDGTEYVVREHISPMRDADGHITHYLAIEDDITEHKCAEERIQYLAHFDALTGLPNRTQLDDHLNDALNLAKRSNENLAVMFLDLDNFKDINDTLGHKIGDALLIELAKRLRVTLRAEDTVSRPGGDEFILLLPGTNEQGAILVAQKLHDAVTEPYRVESYDLAITASIGIAIYPSDGTDMETLSRSADAAMYRAKQEGRNGYRFFTQEMQTRLSRNMQLVTALRQALKLNQLQVHYQPQMSLQDGQITGMEALLRWQHPELGMVSPGEFIPVAESSGLILPIGEWVLRTAVLQARSWMESGLPPMILAVNLSAVQFRHPDLPDLVTRILDETGLPPEYLELELTESVTTHDPLGAIAVMNNLHERGVRMSIDDFGTGYSSLSYLKKFKVYKLKIDQSFVRDISTDPEDKAIVTAIINLARSLSLQTIAEGVETEGQLNFLREQGCNEIQGYFYSKPLPADRFEAFIRSCML